MRILWLKTGPLHPLDTGGKLRTFHMLRALHRRHEITYLSLLPPSVKAEHLASAGEYSSTQKWVPWREARKFSFRFFVEIIANQTSRLPYVISRYRSQEMTDAIEQCSREKTADVMVCDFLTPAVNWLPARTALPSVIFQHNVEARIWQRTAENEKRPLHHWFFRQQWLRLRRFEKQACMRFRGVITVSEEDALAHRSEYGLSNVLGAVPTGVDAEYFSAIPPNPRPRSLIFLGSMDWLANQDSVRWFAEAIFPKLKATLPGLTVTVCGRNPPADILALPIQDQAWRVTGTVKDVRPHLAESAVLIVPLRIGGGTRIKIYEGIAAGLPVVSTRIGAEGLPLRDGEHLSLADEPNAFAHACAKLLQDEVARSAMASRALQYVRENFSWDAVARIFERQLEQVL